MYLVLLDVWNEVLQRLYILQNPVSSIVTYRHACMHACVYACTHIQAYTHMYMYACMQMHVHEEHSPVIFTNTLIA